MRRWYLAGGILLAAVCILSILTVLIPEKRTVSQVESQIAAELSAGPAGAEAETRPEARDPDRTEAEETGREPYASPVDFESLQEMNPDIYAWLHIPGTGISYPVLQRDGDGAYYLDHNSEGEPDPNGALFTEGEYNGRDFEDPAVVIYGHHMRSGAMFGNLQALYSDGDALEKHPDITVYLPDREYHYTVFAAVPFENDHILYYYDFDREEEFGAFLRRVYGVRRIGASGSRKEPEFGSRILILSTCLSGNNQKRYLVLAERTDDKS